MLLLRLLLTKPPLMLRLLRMQLLLRHVLMLELQGRPFQTRLLQRLLCLTFQRLSRLHSHLRTLLLTHRLLLTLLRLRQLVTLQAQLATQVLQLRSRKTQNPCLLPSQTQNLLLRLLQNLDQRPHLRHLNQCHNLL
jgi:hypothetical protein